MHPRISLRLAFLILCGILSVLSATVLLWQTLTPPPPPDTVMGSLSPAAYQYLLQTTEGRIGVYDYESKQLLQLLEIYPVTLPPYDQERLLAGIPVTDGADLQQRIEEFDS